MTIDLISMVGERLEKAAEATNPLSVEEFCAKRLKIRDKVGEVVDFNLKPIQKTYLARKRHFVRQGKPRKFLLLKYRRGGFTTLEQAENYRIAATTQRAHVATVAHTQESTEKISMIPRLFMDEDPLLPIKDDGRTISRLFPHTKSKFFLGTAGGKGFARGDTLNRIHCSEVAWWCPGPNQIDEVDKLMAGITEATSHGEVVCESTPNGIEWFAMKFKEAMKGLNDWNPIFLPWYSDTENQLDQTQFDEQELIESITEEEKEFVERTKTSLPQLAWRRAKIKSLGRLFKQEYPEDPDTCFITSGTPFFDLDLLIALLERLDQMLLKFPQYREEHIPGGRLVIVEEPKDDVEYVAGCDTSEGLNSSDDNGIGIMQKDTGRQVAWIYGRFRPEVLAVHANDLGRRYNDALLGVERQNHGHSVLNTLQNTLSYPNLFFHRNEKGRPGPGKSGRVGWDTNNESRPIMLDELEVLLRDPENHHRWTMREFLAQCTTFKQQSNGRFEADPGCHDDAVAMWAIANQMRKYSKAKSRIILL